LALLDWLFAGAEVCGMRDAEQGYNLDQVLPQKFLAVKPAGRNDIASQTFHLPISGTLDFMLHHSNYLHPRTLPTHRSTI